jgi:ABC-type phosphate/phosphonate transport system substrate-binding protein
MNRIRCVVLGGLLGLAAAAQADSPEDRLIMGVYPGVELGQTEPYDILDRYLPLAEYLSAKTGVKVVVLPVKSPERAMKQMVEGKSVYKLFFGPPVLAAEAIERAGFLPVVVEQERIRAVFVVKATSTLQSLSDFKETTRVAMSSPKLVLSVLAAETLAQGKIALQPGGRQHFSSSDGILLALDSGLADAAVIGERAVKKLTADKSFTYRVIGQTVDVPGFALLAHKSVSDKSRGKLRQAAVMLDKDPSALAIEARARLRTGAFAAAKDDEFQALARMMATWAH